jgi:MFS family permease
MLPLRICSYTFARQPRATVWLQGLDGAGIYGVVVIGLAADVTRGRGRFNILAGLFASALAVGGIVGPAMSGFVVQRTGFKFAFMIFAALALAGATIFSLCGPETKSDTPAGIGSPSTIESKAA